MVLGTLAEMSVSLPSLAFVKAARRMLKSQVIGLSTSEVPGEAPRWTGWSGLHGEGAALLKSMIVCPRWNPHAVQHLVGPLQVGKSLTIDVDCANRSARMWIVSIYRQGREVVTLSTADKLPAGRPHEVTLEPGQYSMFVRYYQPRDGAECPAVVIDGARRIPPQPIAPEAARYAEFLSRIQNKKSPVYYFLHCHVQSALKFRSFLSADFMASLYLPYGNRRTGFFFGEVAANDAIQIEVDADLFDVSSVHVVFLNNCGFPVSWCDAPRPRYVTPPASEAGSYLVRVISPGREVTSHLVRTTVVSDAATFTSGAIHAR